MQWFWLSAQLLFTVFRTATTTYTSTLNPNFGTLKPWYPDIPFLPNPTIILIMYYLYNYVYLLWW